MLLIFFPFSFPVDYFVSYFILVSFSTGAQQVVQRTQQWQQRLARGVLPGGRAVFATAREGGGGALAQLLATGLAEGVPGHVPEEPFWHRPVGQVSCPLASACRVENLPAA